MAAAAAPATRPDGQMLPVGSALVSGELAVLPLPLPPPPPPPPTLPALLLAPEKMSGPDPERRWPGGRGGLVVSGASSPEWLPRAPLPMAALPGAGDLAEPAEEDEDEGVAAAGRRRSGETGEPRSAKTSAFRSGLSLAPASCSVSAAARRRIRSRSASAITGGESGGWVTAADARRSSGGSPLGDHAQAEPRTQAYKRSTQLVNKDSRGELALAQETRRSASVEYVVCAVGRLLCCSCAAVSVCALPSLSLSLSNQEGQEEREYGGLAIVVAEEEVRAKERNRSHEFTRHTREEK